MHCTPPQAQRQRVYNAASCAVLVCFEHTALHIAGGELLKGDRAYPKREMRPKRCLTGIPVLNEQETPRKLQAQRLRCIHRSKLCCARGF